MSPKNLPDWLREDKPENKKPKWWEQESSTNQSSWLSQNTSHQIKQATKISTELNPRTFSGKDAYKKHLFLQTQLTDPFPNSHAPENPDCQLDDPISAAKYEKILKEYSEKDYSADKVELEDALNPIKSPDINCGHKLHLNVTKENVIFVSEYLKREGYCHKYLTGGEISLGKVFTIYIGSFDKTYELAAKISKDLEGKLAHPKDAREIEYAPNIIGRFKGSNKELSEYGNFNTRGMPLTEELYRSWTGYDLYGGQNPISPQQQFQTSFNILAEDHGEYFYGTSHQQKNWWET